MYYLMVMYWRAEMQQVIRSIEIHVPPSNVWRWLATQEGLRHWMSANIEIDLRVGGAYRFLGPDNQTWISGTVLELVQEKSLILSWLEEGSGWIHPARLVITLAPTAAGTRVTLIHDGFEGIGRREWAETVQDYERGADLHRILDRLADLVSAARQGRKQVYRLEPDALIAELTPWIAKYEQYWSAALERLRDLAQDRGAKHRLASRKIVRRRRLK